MLFRSVASKSGKASAKSDKVGPTKHSTSKSGKRSKGKAGKAHFMSMSIMTPAPTPNPRPTTFSPSPTIPFSTEQPSLSTMPTFPIPNPTYNPTLSNCDDPGTCQNRLIDQIFALSVRMGTVDALSDPSSPQSQARNWIIAE